MKRILIILALLYQNTMQATVVAKGNSTTSGTTFTVAVNSATFYPPTQTWYIGLAASGGDYAVSKASLAGPNGSPTFTAIGSDTDITDELINDLTHFTMSAGGQEMLAFHKGSTPNSAVDVMRADGTRQAVSGTLKLADNSTDCTKIHAMIGDQTGHVFAIVSGADSTAWAAANDAIARVTVADNDPVTLTLPAPLDIDAATHFLVTGTTTPTVTNATALAYTPDMGGRLYVGASVLTGGTADNAAFGIIACSVDSDGALTRLPLTGADSTCIATVLSTTPLAVEVATTGAAQSVTITKLAVMKTSTGFYYLISCGGPEAYNGQGNSRNQVYALPLVAGNATAATNGTLASTNLTTDDFSVQCTLQAHMGLITDTDVLVGGGVLPIAANDSDIFVSDLQVVGDTVYCGIQSDTVNSSNAPGIYYSQAIFNEKGKVIRWTDWAKAAPFGLGDSSTDGSTKFFAVDATNGEIWAVSTDGTIVKKTEWTKAGTGTTSLVAQLNSWFADGCYCAYDLNQSTVNFGNQTAKRYAFFGGPAGKVVFAKVSTGGSAAYTAPQTDTTDYTAATAYYETTISGDASPVVALGYSKSSTANQGYFFAGTKNGFYAWGPFTASSLADLNASPFTSSFSWQQLTGILGAVKKIVSTENQVYVLTRDLDRTNTTYTDRVYRFALGTSVSTLNTNVTLIATSGTGSGTVSDFSTATLFFDIHPLIAAADGSDDKLLLATNDGIFQSALAVEDDTTQTEATWTQVSNPATDNTVYDLLTGPTHTRLQSNCWASHWSDDAHGHGTYTRSSWRKIVSDDDATTVLDLPNAQFCTDGSTITDAVPTKVFWSDGARRFFIGIPANSDGLTNKIYCLPYRVGTTDWNITAEPGALADNALLTQNRFYWVQAIGATGAIFAGGNKGVVSLE